MFQCVSRSWFLQTFCGLRSTCPDSSSSEPASSLTVYINAGTFSAEGRILWKAFVLVFDHHRNLPPGISLTGSHLFLCSNRNLHVVLVCSCRWHEVHVHPTSVAFLRSRMNPGQSAAQCRVNTPGETPRKHLEASVLTTEPAITFMFILFILKKKNPMYF